MQTKLDRRNVEDIIPLTPMQEGMLFHYIKDSDSLEYHEQVSIDFVGDINADFMQKAWNVVIAQNEMLRTVYRWKGIDKPIQVVLKEHYVEVQIHDIYEKEAVEKEKFLNEVKQADLQNRIDLEKETLRITLCKCSERDYTMIISNHHILYDGWSNGIIIKELVSAYDTLSQGLEPQISVKNKFNAYVKWMQSQDKIKQKTYWERYLYGVEQNDTLFSRTVSKMNSYEVILSKNIADQLLEFARESSVSVASLLYTAWGILIQKLNNTHDIMLGMTVSGRNSEIQGIEKMVGLFINTIPLRIQSDEEETIIQLLEKVNEITKESHEFESTPLVDINEYAGLSNQSQLFNSLVVIENYPLNVDDYQDGPLKINEYSAIERTNYNLTLGIMIQESIKLNFGYNCFSDDQMIVRIGQYFETIISVMISDKNSKIVDIDILSKAEKDQLLYEFNDTYADYPREKTIHQLFEEQVIRTPDHVALVFNGEQMTYIELNERANQIARVLRASGVKPDDIVGIMVERSFEMMIGILGVLKAGGAYLPIDSEYPTERIKFMLEDSGAEILLTKSCLSEVIKFSRKQINLDEGWLYEGEADDLEVINDPNDLAYVIYTSGSTGKPKGVMVEHRNLMNYICWASKAYFKGEDEVLPFYSSIGFDLTVTSVFTPLITGNKIIIYDNDKKELVFHKVLKENKATVVKLTPAHLTLLKNMGQRECNIKRFIVGGDDLNVELAKEIRNRINGVEIYNEYGPTEATVGCMIHKYDRERDRNPSVPIGRSISNTQVYIMNNNVLCGIGIPGELCISGEGVTRGYLNRPELTAEKFVDNPFISGGRMYRTGDLARWLPDGNIECLGRIDHQVKIRGFRIELGEIENQLLKIDNVKEVVVVAREDETKDKYLCAYYVSNEELLVSELKQQLSDALPSYMMPSYFIQLEKLPLTSNGKLDKKALPEPERSVQGEYVAPRNAMEEALVSIWSEVLGREQIGINDNFFELGGHSLRATVIMSRIHKALNVDLPLKELFKSPTISGISNYLSQVTKNEYVNIEAVEEKEYYETSSAQKRMWLLQQFDLKSTAYNMSGVFVIEGDLDKNHLESVFLELINRHELLRTRFEMVEDVIVQRVEKSVEFEIKYAESTEEKMEEIIRGFIRPFDLSETPLLRVGLISINDAYHYLMFDMHHIISDGVSMGILAKEFMMLYEGQELEKQRIQYKDFSVWQNDYLKSDKMQEQEKYWLEQFSDELPVLDLPLDYVRPMKQSYEGGSVEFRLTSELTEKLNSLAQETGTTLYMVLLSVIKILLSMYSGQEDIIVGSPVAGRPHVDLERMIGMFVNTMAIRTYPEQGKSYLDFLEEVKQTTLKAYENQDYQFEVLVEKLNLKRDVSRNPLFDVMFVLQNMEAINLEIDGLKLNEYKREEVLAKFDLSFTAKETTGEIVFNIRYRTALFKKETIEQMARHLQDLFEAIIEDRTIQI